MPEYLSPGVYVEEIDAGPKPIEGVSTSTAGAVGITAFGPTSGKPELVTSFAEFMRKFGGFLAEPGPSLVNKWLTEDDGGKWWQFPLAVKGFFDNGGQRLYVKRVFSSGSKASSAAIGKGIISELVGDVAATSPTLKLRHLIGIAVQRDGAAVTLRVFRGDTQAQIGAGFTVVSYDPQATTVTLNAPVGTALSVKRGDFVEVIARTASPVSDANSTLKFTARSRGKWGDALSVRVRPMVGSTLAILPDAAGGGAVARTTLSKAAQPGDTNLEVASVSGLANNDRVMIAGREYTVSNVPADPTTTLSAQTNANATTITVANPAGLADGDKVEIDGNEYTLSNANGNDFDIDNPAPADWPANTTEVRKLPRSVTVAPGIASPDPLAVGTPIRRIRPANAPNASPKISVSGAAGLYKGALVELDNGTRKEFFTVSSVEGDVATLSGNIVDRFYEGHVMRVIEAQVGARLAPEGGPASEEEFANLRLVKDGSLSNLLKYVKTRSTMLDLDVEGAAYGETAFADFPGTPSGGWLALSGGDDSYDSLSSDDFAGSDGGSGKRTGIKALEDIDEISISLAPGMWAKTIHNELIQQCEILKDRFAIIDPPPALSIEGIRTFREPTDTKYAALYYPWIEVRDPSVRRNVEVAPSGHLAGIYARVDVERGVHKAPANEVVRGITKIAQDVTKREQDMLNPKNINALRFFPGRGNRVWGARVVTSDSAWKYINVRRLFIFVEESIDEGTQWVVFEPNDEPLWARVRQSVTNFLTTVWRSGALEGSKAEQAFFVKCDRTTMTQDDIDNGRLICVIGIAPVKPAEFVIFRIQQKTRDSQTS